MNEVGGRKDVEISVPLLRHMILNTIRSFKQRFGSEYGEIVIACDNKKYWRKEFFPYYKANRKKAREDSGYDWSLIFDTMSTIKSELDLIFPYKVIDVDGAEADDVIASLAEYSQTLSVGNALFEGDPPPFLIISGDHDFVQLQRYNNVTQFSPVQKKYVKADTTPQRIVLEHTFRGDKGDGVPNVLSADDSIVAGERQKPVTAKKIEEWINKLPDDSEFQARFKRNQVLVDFNFIPQHIKDAVIDKYKSQPKKDRSQLLNYFMKHKMKQMIELIEEF
jgi:5'-3' exonuclease